MTTNTTTLSFKDMINKNDLTLAKPWIRSHFSPHFVSDFITLYNLEIHKNCIPIIYDECKNIILSEIKNNLSQFDNKKLWWSYFSSFKNMGLQNNFSGKLETFILTYSNDNQWVPLLDFLRKEYCNSKANISYKYCKILNNIDYLNKGNSENKLSALLSCKHFRRSVNYELNSDQDILEIQNLKTIKKIILWSIKTNYQESFKACIDNNKIDSIKYLLNEKRIKNKYNGFPFNFNWWDTACYSENLENITKLICKETKQKSTHNIKEQFSKYIQGELIIEEKFELSDEDRNNKDVYLKQYQNSIKLLNKRHFIDINLILNYYLNSKENDYLKKVKKNAINDKEIYTYPKRLICLLTLLNPNEMEEFINQVNKIKNNHLKQHFLKLPIVVKHILNNKVILNLDNNKVYRKNKKF